jgi:hypothetical protein
MLKRWPRQRGRPSCDPSAEKNGEEKNDSKGLPFYNNAIISILKKIKV